MYKDIKRHEAFIKSQLESMTPERAQRLYSYHADRLRDFQHERLVHLLVTLFFGLLVIASVTALFLTLAVPSLMVLIGTASILLLATEICYVGYYFLLENGVQRLYALSERLYELW